MRRAAIVGPIALSLAAAAAALGFVAGRAESRASASHIEETDVDWGANPDLPLVRWKTLVGDDGLSQRDVRFGTFELAPNAVYPAHLHPAPEVYFVVSGRASWTVGDETFEAAPGTAVYAPPGTPHRMENRGSEPVRAVWVWWAPGGDRSVFESGYRFVEPLPAKRPAP